MTILYMILAIIFGSAISLAGGLLLLRTKKYRERALLLALPFGAGALLAAAFFDLLPESFELAHPATMLLYALGGFLAFFMLERLAGWFHDHHDHGMARDVRQRRLIVVGDIIHNAIDGMAIGAAFLVSVPTGIIATIAVGAHEVPREIGTFALLLSRGWQDKKVIIANLLTIIATVIAALVIYLVGVDMDAFVAPLLAIVSGVFIYIAASDIIPDIHEQPQRTGMIQAGMLIFGLVIVALLIELLHTH